MPPGVHMSLVSIRYVMKKIPPSICIQIPAGIHIALGIKMIPLRLIVPDKTAPAIGRIGAVGIFIPPAIGILYPLSGLQPSGRIHIIPAATAATAAASSGGYRILCEGQFKCTEMVYCQFNICAGSARILDPAVGNRAGSHILTDMFYLGIPSVNAGTGRRNVIAACLLRSELESST